MKRQRQLGAVTDDPREIMDTAIRELRARGGTLGMRQAAEKAHLALTSSVEVATRRQVHTHGEELEAVRVIARRAKDPHLDATYRALRRTLHGECFHQNQCGTPEELGVKIGEAKALMERILRTRSRTRR